MQIVWLMNTMGEGSVLSFHLVFTGAQCLDITELLRDAHISEDLCT